MKELTVPPWAIVKHSASLALFDLSKKIAFIILLEQRSVEKDVITSSKYKKIKWKPVLMGKCGKKSKESVF